MRIARTVAELRGMLGELRADRARGLNTGAAARVGFVPTMGALHEGHLSLVQAARADNEIVVLSIFVNPTQFNEASDLDAYPRQEAADVQAAEAAGVDAIFAPSAAEMYPAGFASTVTVRGLITSTLEGENRGPEHFDGMATVVAKLLLAVQADAAYFGQKDAQQLVVVQRMVADLGIPTRVVGCPTSRDADGLARSSRNVRLDAAGRQAALAIPRSLDLVSAMAHAGERDVAALQRAAQDMLDDAGLTVEYIAVVNPGTFESVETITDDALCLIAARVGDVRLIDNMPLSVAL